MSIIDKNFNKTAIEGITEKNIISDLFLSNKNIDLIHLKIINTIKKNLIIIYRNNLKVNY